MGAYRERGSGEGGEVGGVGNKGKGESKKIIYSPLQQNNFLPGQPHASNLL